MIYSSRLHDAQRFARCGRKAWNLARLSEAGFRCPPFLCIGPDDRGRIDEIQAALAESGILPPFSVRSSAGLEDGEERSFAGQFTTFLNVGEEELPSRIWDCFQSAADCGAELEDVHVLVQQMVPAELSGVFFTRNPMGIMSEAVTVVGAGTGDHVVEDLVPTTTWYDNRADGVSYHTSQPGAPALPDLIRKELLDSVEPLERIFGPGLDVEYAVANGALWFLQVRKITALKRGTPIILDSSNIAESYPGVTLPLTADFVTRQYAAIFKGVMTRLSGGASIARTYGDAFDHMVASYNGRMYYRIENWYGVIRFLPFSKKILPLWREMLGVRGEDAPESPMRASPIQKLSVALHTAYYFFRSPAKMARLEQEFLKMEERFLNFPKRPESLDAIWEIYCDMETAVMGKWDYTLINDMYAFLHTGLFRWIMRKKGADETEIQKLLAQAAQLASLRPVRELVALGLIYKRQGSCAEFKRGMDAYLDRYGDRSVGELKLETETFREAPERLMAQIRQYAQMPTEELEALARKLSEDETAGKRSRACGVSGLAGYFLRCAGAGIENRESSRLNRARLFGFARTLFLRAGELLVQEGRVDSCRDVFYLTEDELFGHDGRDLRPLAARRKFIYDSYAAYPPYTRVIFDSAVVSKPCLDLPLETGQCSEGVLRGTPCSPGKAVGPVLCLDGANAARLEESAAGKIVVTRSTDPGWAFLLASAAGLISEQGSLLSHTAIIARELKIPALVGVSGAVVSLADGDMVELDCEIGTVRRL